MNSVKLQDTKLILKASFYTLTIIIWKEVLFSSKSFIVSIWQAPVCLNREGNGTPLQYSCLENPMDGGAWWAAVYGVAKSQTRLSYFTFTSHFHALEKEMATHSSVFAWRIPGTWEPGGLPSMGLHRVGHNWSDLAAAAEKLIRAFFPRCTNIKLDLYRCVKSPNFRARRLCMQFFN